MYGACVVLSNASTCVCACVCAHISWVENVVLSRKAARVKLPIMLHEWPALSLFSTPALLWKSKLKYYYSAVIKLQHVKFKSLASPSQNRKEYCVHTKHPKIHFPLQKHNLRYLVCKTLNKIIMFFIFGLNLKVLQSFNGITHSVDCDPFWYSYINMTYK